MGIFLGSGMGFCGKVLLGITLDKIVGKDHVNEFEMPLSMIYV